MISLLPMVPMNGLHLQEAKLIENHYKELLQLAFSEEECRMPVQRASYTPRWSRLERWQPICNTGD